MAWASIVGLSLLAATQRPRPTEPTLQPPPDDGEPAVPDHDEPAVQSPSVVLKGERHAGTNFMASFLSHNIGGHFRGDGTGSVPNLESPQGCDHDAETPSKHLCCCCKHGYAAEECAGSFTPPVDAHVLLVRNPYSWLEAMYRNTYEFPIQPRPSTMGEFLRQEFTSLRYCQNETSREFADKQPGPVELWLAKVQSYEALSSDKAILAHYDLFDEDTLRAKLAPLLEGAHVKLRTGQLTYMPWDTSNDKGAQVFTQEGWASAREWEDTEGWLHGFTDDDVRYVADKLAPHQDRLEALGLNLTWSGTRPSTRGASFRSNTTELAERERYAADAWDYLG